MFDILLPENGHGPLYMQLYRHIRGLIQRGVVKDGTKIPSIRSLRQQLHISKTTIETAYQMLLEEGYVVSKPRSGLFVVNPQSIQPSTLDIEDAHNVEDIHLLRSNHTPHSLHHGVIDFNLLAVDGDSFPIQSWKSVLIETIAKSGSSIHQYGDPKGEYALRMSLAQYLKTSRGVSCLPEQIVIGSGISYSIHLLSRLFEESPTIAFEEGGIAQVREIFDQNGFQIMDFPMHGNELFVNKMEEKNVHAIYMTPSHRPSGNPLPYSIRLQTLRWAYTNHAYIIEDDYDGEFRYSGKTIPSLQGLDQKGVVIYIGTFSKAFTPALRMNYMVLPIHLMKKLLTMEHLLSCPSRIDQLAMKLFIERGYWYRQIRRMRNIYRKKHYKLIQLIQMYLSAHVQIASDSAGLHIELIVKTECSAEKLVELALTEGVRVYSSQDKEMNRSTINPKIYLGFGGISMKDMESGVQLLRKAWASVHVAEKSEAN